MLWAVTGHTAAEIIGLRSDAAAPNMGLTSWAGSVVRKIDVDVSKNYLTQPEIAELDLIVTMYLDYAELQAKNRQAMNMAEWDSKLDAFLVFNERELLTHSGTVRTDVAKKLAEDRYEAFDAERKAIAAAEADQEDLAALAALQQATDRVTRSSADT